MEIQNDTSATGASGQTESAANGFQSLSSDDFLKLLITQLQNQDPLAPTSNEQLMQQFSTIREIEMSVSLTDAIQGITDQQAGVTKTLQALNDQQRFSAASTMIGKYVRGPIPEEGSGDLRTEGLVRAVRFDENGQAVLELAGGRELPLAEVHDVTELTNLKGRLAEFFEKDGNGVLRLNFGEILEVTEQDGVPVFKVDTGELLPRTVPVSDVVGVHNLRVVEQEDTVEEDAAQGDENNPPQEEENREDESGAPSDG